MRAQRGTPVQLYFLWSGLDLTVLIQVIDEGFARLEEGLPL